MPYNLLLLPLLAGFLLIARARIFSYATSQLQKDQLLLWASFAGLCLLMVSRVVCMSLVDTTLGDFLLQLKEVYAPFPYIGTALGTIGIAILFVLASNALIPESEVGLWTYHAEKFNQLESLLLSSAIGVSPAGAMSYQILLRRQLKLDLYRTCKRFLDRCKGRPMTGGYSLFPTGDPQLVMITLADNKVYVGFVAQLPPIVASRIEYLRIAPVWSGYRDADRRVYRTTSYEEALLGTTDHDMLIKVVPTKNIVAVGLYVDGTFPIRDINEAGVTTRRRKLTRPRARRFYVKRKR